MPMALTSEPNDVMSARERSDLSRLVRQRERVAKSEVKSRRARLKADAEQEMNTIFAAKDALWKDLTALAQEGMRTINAQLAARACEVGIPKAMGHPRLELGWRTIGREYGDRDRRSEIRKMIDSRLADMEASSLAEIEQRSLGAQTEILAGGLTSEAARAVLASLPSVEALMPPLDLGALELVMPGLSSGTIATTVAAIQAGDIPSLKLATGTVPAAALGDGDDDDDDEEDDD
jgi:hypothetical protein